MAGSNEHSRLDEDAGRLLAHVSHEIRTELSGILGMAEVLADTRLSPEQREFVGLIASSGDALMTLVNDLLDLSKINAGGLTLQEVPFSLHDAFTDAVSSFRGSAVEKGIELVINVGDAVPDRVAGDPGRLRQVIANLVGNAVKFTSSGVITASVEVEDNATSMIRFQITDTGRGVDPAVGERIFQAFVQAAGPAHEARGTGLGLSISRQIAELMGGRMWMESQVGVGSVFAFTARLEPADEGVDQLRVSPHALAGLPVAIQAGPEQGEILAKMGLALTSVPDRDELVRVLKVARIADAPYALAILEGPGALSAAEHLRRDDAHAATHLMVITPSGERGDAARCRELRVGGYLTGPVGPDDLAEAVSAVLSGPAPVDLTTLVTRHWLRERRRRLSILLVDDSPTNRMVATRVLERRGHAVTAVATGQEAIELAEMHRFDAILVDAIMPGMSGAVVIRKIREHEQLSSRVPLIALCGDRHSPMAASCLEAGAAGILSKPIDVFELTSEVEEAAAVAV